MEAVIIAGGKGTRLQGVVSDVPKPMAPINNTPFLEILLNKLQKENIHKVILAVGYKNEIIKQYFGNKYKDIEILYSVEKEPLGTGGALKKASKLVSGNSFLAINGDTFFDIELKHLCHFHNKNNSDITIALKYLENFDRYGNVEVEKNKVYKFNEKEYKKQGFINGGIYCISKNVFKNINTESFSFEKDIMEKLINKISIQAQTYKSYFIDIGIPEDYKKAQIYFSDKL